MKYDVDRYTALVRSAALNYEFFRGTYQDLSSARREMTAVGTPRFYSYNGRPCFSGSTTANYAQSGVVAACLDVTTAFYVEAAFRCSSSGYLIWALGPGVAGGWRLTLNTTPALRLDTFTLAAGFARQVTGTASFIYGQMWHGLIRIDPVGLTGGLWMNGTPSPVTFTNTNPPANGAPNNIYVAGPAFAGTAYEDLLLLRAWQGTPTNEDASALYGAAQELIRA